MSEATVEERLDDLQAEVASLRAETVRSEAQATTAAHMARKVNPITGTPLAPRKLSGRAAEIDARNQARLRANAAEREAEDARLRAAREQQEAEHHRAEVERAAAYEANAPRREAAQAERRDVLGRLAVVDAEVSQLEERLAVLDEAIG